MPPRFALAALIAFFIAPTWAAAQEFPYVGYVQRDDVYLRSGPGKNYYATTRLYEGDTVDVYRHDPGGWCAVRPPQGSFSWVLASQVRLVDGQMGVVEADEAVARVGTDHGDTRDVIQVRLDRGEEVVVLEAQQFGEGANAVTWFKIAPPAGEFRWVAAADIAREPRREESVEVEAIEEAIEESIEDESTRDESEPPRRLKPVAAKAIEADDSDRSDEEVSDEMAEDDAAADDEEIEQPKRAKKKPLAPRPAKRRPAELVESEEADVEEVGYDDADSDAIDEEVASEDDRPRRRPARASRLEPEDRDDYDDEGDDEASYDSDDDAMDDDQVEPAQYQTPMEKSRARRAAAADKIRAERVASRQKYERDHEAENIYPPRVRDNDGRSGDVSGDHESADLPPGAALEEIDLALSRMVTEEPQHWKLQPLKLRAEEILSQASTAVERGRARLLVGRIERFEDVQIRAKALGSAQASIEARRGRVEQVREARRATPASADLASSRYDGVGKLAQMESNKPGGASYALVDSAGRVRSYVTPAPGVNLRHYLGRSVGITGTQGYLPDADRHHVTARRVTVLDGRTLR